VASPFPGTRARASGPDKEPVAAVKFTLVFFAVIVLVVAVGYRQAKQSAKKSDAQITEVANILEQAVANAPPAPAPPPSGPWIDRVRAECDRREQRLAGLVRPASIDGIGVHASRVHAIHRTYARRVSSLRPPAAYRAEAGTIDRLNARQVRVLGRVARLAGGGDISTASREVRALRVFAGDANSELLRLGLTACLFRPSGMPL
jgi:hypothetical protein